MTNYSILEASSIPDLERMVCVALADGSILEGGVSTAVIVTKSVYGGGPEQVSQTFYQAISTELPE